MRLSHAVYRSSSVGPRSSSQAVVCTFCVFGYSLLGSAVHQISGLTDWCLLLQDIRVTRGDRGEIRVFLRT